MKNEIIIIAAIGKKNELGKAGDLIWKVPGDLARFKKITNGHPVIMGYKTYESMNFKPLPNRTNIVMALEETVDDGVIVARSQQEAIDLAKQSPGGDKIYVIGGGVIYDLFLPKVDTLELTMVDDSDEYADTFFPKFNLNDFKEVFREEKEVDDLKFAFITLKKK